MKKRLLSLLLCAFMLCTMLAGCGEEKVDNKVSETEEGKNEEGNNEEGNNENTLDFSWIDLYADYLETESGDFLYTLVDIDGDTILEVYAEGDTDGYLLSISDGKVECRNIEYGGMYYIPGQNCILISEMDNGYASKVCHLQNGNVVMDHMGVYSETGPNGTYKYIWDGKEVSSEEYSKKLSEVWNSTESEYIHGYISLSKFVEEMQGIANIEESTKVDSIIKKIEYKHTNCDGGGIISEYTKDFDESGLLTKYHYFKVREYEEEEDTGINQTFTWKQSGLTFIGTTTSSTVYEIDYNEKGQVICERQYDDEYQLRWKKEYKYYGAALIETIITGDYDELWSVSKYNYFGDVVEYYEYSDGVIQKERFYEYTYNEDGTVKSAYVREINSMNYKYEYKLNYEYTYNADGSLKEFYIYKPVEGFGNETETYIYTYWE